MDIELGIKNFDKQQAIFDSPARYKIVVKGRRFGLTRGAANDFIQSALKGEFKQGLWVDTVHANIMRYVDRYFLPHLQKLPKGYYNWHKQEKILHICNSFIDFRSVDNPQNIEGFGYDKFFLNEAGIILKNDYLWQNAIKPMLWEFPNVKGVIGGTPKGMGLFHELAQLGKASDRPDYAYFHYTTFDNPRLPKAVIEQDMLSTPEHVIRQEFYAEFLDDAGVVFRNVQAIATAAPRRPISGHLYVMGVDLAKVQDYTVITVYDRTDNHQVYQDRFNKLDWPFQKNKIADISRFYNNALVYLDATGIGDPIADDLIRSKVPVEPIKFTNESKKEMIQKMAIWIEQAKMHILPDPLTLEEFNSFTYDVSSSGKIQYNAPVGLHDDIVFAHALAVWGLQPVIAPTQYQEPTLIQLALKKSRENHYADAPYPFWSSPDWFTRDSLWRRHD